MNKSEIIFLTFLITGLWDIILRTISLNNEKISEKTKLPMLDIIVYLKPYFEHHTLLSAALIAGFVGATTQAIILHYMRFPSKNMNNKYMIKFMIVTFMISGLYGLIMQMSGMFPILDKYSYKRLGKFRGFYHDGISGIIVQSTIIILGKIYDKMK